MEEENKIESVSTEEPSAVQPETTPVEPAGNAETPAPVENTQPEVKGTPEKPQYTDLEKAQYSFHRQFSKQKAKYEKMLSDRDEQFKQMADRLDRLEHPEKYAPKTRDQFETDDDFINSLVDDKVQKILAQKLEEYQKQEDEQKKQTELEGRYKSIVDENVSKLYSDEAALKDYHEKLDNALADGLGDLIDADEQLSRYIMMSPLGPKIMYEFATNMQTVDNFFKEGVTPLDRQFLIRDLERNLASQPVIPPVPTAAPQEPPKPAVPVVGKPGINRETPQKDIFHDKDAMREFLRR